MAFHRRPRIASTAAAMNADFMASNHFGLVSVISLPNQMCQKCGKHHEISNCTNNLTVIWLGSWICTKGTLQLDNSLKYRI